MTFLCPNYLGAMSNKLAKKQARDLIQDVCPQGPAKPPMTMAEMAEIERLMATWGTDAPTPLPAVVRAYQNDDAFAEIAQALMASKPTHYRGGPCCEDERAASWDFVDPVTGADMFRSDDPQPRGTKNVTCRACLTWASLVHGGA